MVLISQKLAMLLRRHDIINDNDLEIYSYSFYSIISYIAESILLLLIGILLKEYIKALIFVIIFPALRKHTGGYHANTKVKCIILSVILFILYIFIAKLIVVNSNAYYFSMYLISTIYLIVVYEMSPARTPQKKLSQEIAVYNRKVSLVQGCVLFLFSCAIAGIQRNIISSLVTIQLEVATLVIVSNIGR